MIRNDRFFVSGGIVGIRTADGAIHTSRDEEPIKKRRGTENRKKVDENHYETNEDPSVCLGCGCKECTGEKDCYLAEQSRREGGPGELLYLAFTAEREKALSEGVKLMDIAEEAGISIHTMRRCIRRRSFAGKTAECIIAWLRKRGVYDG